MNVQFKAEAATSILCFASVEIMVDPDDSDYVYARLHNGESGDTGEIQHCEILWNEEGHPYFMFNEGAYRLDEFMRV